MKFCYYCGKEIPEGSRLCPYCGRLLQPQQAERPKIDGGTKGKSIASIILGAEALSSVLGNVLMIFYDRALGFTAMWAEYGLNSLLYEFLVFLSFISLCTCFAGKLLARKVLLQHPEFNPARIGHKLCSWAFVASLLAIFATILAMSGRI